MNWGKGIAIVLALFMGFIIYLAVTLMTQNVDLESEDYYVREMAYQNEIEAIQNAKLYPPVNLELQQEHVIVQVPDSVTFKEVQVLFRRPNNDKLDKTFDLKDTKMLALEKTLFKSGAYDVEISYLSEGKPCLIKDKIYI